MSNCDCALRSFWDGPCPEHAAEYTVTHNGPAKFSDYGAAVQLEFNKVFDPIIEEIALDLGRRVAESMNDVWKAGLDVEEEHNIHGTT